MAQLVEQETLNFEAEGSSPSTSTQIQLSGVTATRQSPKLHDGSSNLPASAIAEWCNGSTPDSDSGNIGSIPVSAAHMYRLSPGGGRSAKPTR